MTSKVLRWCLNLGVVISLGLMFAAMSFAGDGIDEEIISNLDFFESMEEIEDESLDWVIDSSEEMNDLMAEGRGKE